MWNNSWREVILMRSLNILFVVPVIILAVSKKFNEILGIITITWATLLIIIELL